MNFFDRHQDFRQTSQYANFMKNLGWKIIKNPNFLSENSIQYAYLWRVPWVGGYYLSLHRINLTVDLKKIIDYSLRNNVFLIRVDFNSSKTTPKLIRELAKYKFKAIDWCNAPTKTKVLYLKEMTITDVFNQFKPKTRYNIRLAEKKKYFVGLLSLNDLLKIRWVVPQFHKLLQARFQIKGLEPFSVNQIFQLLESFDKRAFLGIALKDKMLLTAAIFISSGTTLSYTQNSVSSEGKKLFAPTLVIWEAIKYAKKAGLHYFDFEGVFDKRNLKLTNSWHGFTQFKNGFGGIDLEFVLPYQRLFLKNNFLDKFKNKIRKKYFEKSVLPSIYPSRIYIQ